MNQLILRPQDSSIYNSCLILFSSIVFRTLTSFSSNAQLISSCGPRPNLTLRDRTDLLLRVAGLPVALHLLTRFYFLHCTNHQQKLSCSLVPCVLVLSTKITSTNPMSTRVPSPECSKKEKLYLAKHFQTRETQLSLLHRNAFPEDKGRLTYIEKVPALVPDWPILCKWVSKFAHVIGPKYTEVWDSLSLAVCILSGHYRTALIGW